MSLPFKLLNLGDFLGLAFVKREQALVHPPLADDFQVQEDLVARELQPTGDALLRPALHIEPGNASKVPFSLPRIAFFLAHDSFTKPKQSAKSEALFMSQLIDSLTARRH